MNCVRIPLSLDDATAIVECAGGSDWRSAFVLGLETVVALMAVAWVIWLLVSRARA